MYNTGNPLGSTSPKDFSDNAEITDRYVNDIANESTRDRFGRIRLTIHGQQERARRSFEQFESSAANVITNLGFFPPVDYTAGLTVDSSNFTVTYNDVVYAAQPSAVPFTTGAWDDAQWYPIQNVLNQKNLLVFDTYAEASAAAATLPDGQDVEAPDAQGKLSRYRVQSGVLVFQRLAADANSTNYVPAGAGAVARTVQSKLREMVSVKDFGAVGDGVADDTVAVQAALNSDQPLDWGGLTYRITSTVSRMTTKDVFWQGRNATIMYDGAHTERAVILLGGGIEYVINDITIDGAKLVNKCFEIDNNTDSYSNLTCNNVFVTRAKRLNTFSGGAGMWVRGAFDSVSFNGGGASDCELPAGQGTSGSVGIAGISATPYSTTRYVRAMYVNGTRIEKIYSSDLSYQEDQDGIQFFSPTDGTRKVPSLFSCVSSEFVNCYGRSIKTQCRDTVVQASSFIRTEGLASGRGNGEIDAQTGNGNFRDLTFSYSNGQEPRACVNVSGAAGTPGILVDGCSVVLDNSTTLSMFAQVFPSGGTFSRHTVSNNKVFGAVVNFFAFLCNGNKNYAEVSNNFVQEIVDGATSEKALVYVLSSGSITPRYAYITAYGNVYGDTHLPALVRDGVSGNTMGSNLSAWGNYGFQVKDVATPLDVNGLKTNAIARMAKVGGYEGNGYFQVENVVIPGSSTATVAILNNSQPTLVFIVSQFNATSYATFVNSSTGNVGLNVGAAFNIGNTTDPGSGTFRIWTSATNEITISNTNTSSRSFSIFAMVGG